MLLLSGQQNFIITFPELNRLIRTRKEHLKCILQYFKQFINEEMQIDGKPFVFSTYSKLLNVCGMNVFENTRGTSTKSDIMTIDIVNSIMKLIENKKYARECEVIEILGNRYRNQFKKSIQEILDSYNLVQFRESKKNLTEYEIIDDKLNYHMLIICRKND